MLTVPVGLLISLGHFPLVVFLGGSDDGLMEGELSGMGLQWRAIRSPSTFRVLLLPASFRFLQFHNGPPYGSLTSASIQLPLSSSLKGHDNEVEVEAPLDTDE